jgi:hypothetical protein
MHIITYSLVIIDNLNYYTRSLIKYKKLTLLDYGPKLVWDCSGLSGGFSGQRGYFVIPFGAAEF